MKNIIDKRRERTNLFLSFCDMACPSLREMSKATLGNLTTNLYTRFRVLDELHDEAEAFRKHYPNGVKVKGEVLTMPRRGQNGYEYRQRASAFIKKNTGMVIPVSSVIPCSFYDSIISSCIRKE